MEMEESSFRISFLDKQKIAKYFYWGDPEASSIQTNLTYKEKAKCD